jgi:hypothetical protein
LELLTIITRTLQILSSFVLIVIIFSYVTIKVKSRNNKRGILNFSNPEEGKITMSEGISTKINKISDIFTDDKTALSYSGELKNSDKRKKMKIYAVYNPDSNPNFYLHNKLNWYKDFD